LQKVIGDIQKHAQSFDAGGIEGYYDANLDKLYLVADNLTRETLASVGILELFHRALNVDAKLKAAVDRFQSQMRQRFEAAAEGKGSKEDRDAYQRVIDSGTEEMDYLEEFMAYHISAWETQPQNLSEGLRKLIGDLVAAIKAALMRAGFYEPKTLTPALLSALAKQAGTQINVQNTFSGEPRLAFSTNTPEYKRQYDDIEAKYFNKDGSEKPGAILAPNGEKSKLNKTQWIQVRTQAFKDWFGDWELAATRIEPEILEMKGWSGSATELSALARDVYSTELQGNKVFNKSLNEDVHFTSEGKGEAFGAKGKMRTPIRAELVSVLKHVIEKGVKVGDAPPKESRTLDSKRFHTLISAFVADGNIYSVKLTVREALNSLPGEHHKFYDVTAIQIKQDTDVHGLKAGSLSQPLPAPVGVYKPTIQELASAFNIGEGNYLNSVSKITDANGEPMVVYHGTNADFNTFDIDKSSSSNRFGAGFYFTRDGKTMSAYSGKEASHIVPVFLNMRTPITGIDLTEAQINRFFEAVKTTKFKNGYDAKQDQADFKRRALDNPGAAFETLSSAAQFIDKTEYVKGWQNAGIDGFIQTVFRLRILIKKATQNYPKEPFNFTSFVNNELTKPTLLGLSGLTENKQAKLKSRHCSLAQKL
jgi:ADP-Ribosyltransferase in polyvalent proteins/Large polyvalent protein-associated domain 3